METVHINLGGGYPVHIGEGLLTSNRLVETCRGLGTRFVIITDAQVRELYGEDLAGFLSAHGLDCHIVSFAAGEKNKTREVKQQVEDKMLQLQLGRDSCVIAIGGGVVTDLAGFVAATYCRGIPAVYLPTTTLAMVDAGIGGKTGVNTPFGKNLVGIIRHPAAVFADVKTTRTLGDEDFVGGMVEALKHALITSRQDFEQIATDADAIFKRQMDVLTAAILRSSEIKRDLVERDEHEAGLRQRLNLGHTVGHAIEHVSAYRISHGAAVALGILGEGQMAVQVGLLRESEFDRMAELIHRFLDFLDHDLSGIDREMLANVMVLDKKSLSGRPRFVLLEAIGKPFMDGERPAQAVSEKAFTAGLNYLMQEFG